MKSKKLLALIPALILGVLFLMLLIYPVTDNHRYFAKKL
jgi:hypothetical protein